MLATLIGLLAGIQRPAAAIPSPPISTVQSTQAQTAAAMAALYDEVCLRAFPADAVVDRRQLSPGATATPLRFVQQMGQAR